MDKPLPVTDLSEPPEMSVALVDAADFDVEVQNISSHQPQTITVTGTSRKIN
jgi:hypothetical protein